MSQIETQERISRLNHDLWPTVIPEKKTPVTRIPRGIMGKGLTDQQSAAKKLIFPTGVAPPSELSLFAVIQPGCGAAMLLRGARSRRKTYPEMYLARPEIRKSVMDHGKRLTA